MLRRRSLLAGMAGSAAMVSLGAGGARAAGLSAAEIRQRGYMRIATTALDAPYTFPSPDGQVSGFDIDWSRLICAGLGVEARFSCLAWRGILPGLMAGQFDGVMSAVRITPERQQSFTFSIPYTTDSAAVMVRADDDKIKEIEDLKNRVVGVASGSVLEGIVNDMAQARTVRSYPGLPDLIMDLMSGRLDAAVVGRGGALYAIHKNHLAVKVVGRALRPQPIAMIMPQGSTDLAAAVSEIITARQADGQAKELYNRWFMD